MNGYISNSSGNSSKLYQWQSIVPLILSELKAFDVWALRECKTLALYTIVLLKKLHNWRRESVYIG